MKTLDKKLLRDLGQLRGQVLTICLVVASGIAAYIVMHSTYRSLHFSMESYYEGHRFSDLFAQADRVPKSVGARLAAIPGVSVVDTRIVEGVRIVLADQVGAVSGRVVSLPDHGPPTQNEVFLRRGRLPESGNEDEVLLLEAFANAHHIETGSELAVVMNGSLRKLRVTGIAMSPEYIFALGSDVLSYEPGSFAVLWMRESSVAAAFDMKGAFNDVVVRIQPGASEPAAIENLDRILNPFGGFGAYGRDKHVSHHFVTSELAQLEVQATVIPVIFLGVAAFLVNVVLNRLVQLQRGQIATLKAVGYSNAAVGFHFLKLVSLIVLLGSVIGIALGAWLGNGLTKVYEQYFSFPIFEARIEADVVGWSVLISLVSAVAGAFISVRRIVALPPAEAMRPPAPPVYRTTLLDRVTGHILGALGRMVVRELQRSPVRVLISSLGIAMAVAILVIGRFAVDSMEFLVDLQFRQAMKEELTVAFREPLPAQVAHSVLQLPGVTHVERGRLAAVRLRFGAASRDTAIEGMETGGRLRVLFDSRGEPVEMPLEGVLLSEILAQRLHVKPGEFLELTPLQGERRPRRVLLSGTVSDMLGMQGYMALDALEALLGDQPLASTLRLAVDADSLDEAEKRLLDMPAVSSVLRPVAAKQRFEKQQAGTMLAMTFVLAFFASVIAIGIVYNNARVSLSMRSRDLASMRVLGFTRREISSVLLSELAVQVVLALPLGMWLGTLATRALLASDPENFRMPEAISMKTYAFATLMTLGATLFSALLVRRKLDKLDLIGVLKTRE